MTNRIYIILVMSLLITGCTVFGYAAVKEGKEIITKLTERLNEKSICCETYTDLDYESLSFGEKININITENNLAREFGTGRSYFKAFDLPESKIPYEISVYSYPMLMDMRKAYVFYPQFILLDKTHKLAREVAPSMIWAQEGVFPRPRLTGAINVLPGESKLIVYTDPSRFGHGSNWNSSVLNFPPPRTHWNSDWNYPLRRAPEGELQLILDKKNVATKHYNIIGAVKDNTYYAENNEFTVALPLIANMDIIDEKGDLYYFVDFWRGPGKWHISGLYSVVWYKLDKEFSNNQDFYDSSDYHIPNLVEKNFSGRGSFELFEKKKEKINGMAAYSFKATGNLDGHEATWIGAYIKYSNNRVAQTFLVYNPGSMEDSISSDNFIEFVSSIKSVN